VALLLVTVIVAIGTAVQFSARCRRCGYQIGLQSRLLRPFWGERCQTRFR
jgi:hypothetical protein